MDTIKELAKEKKRTALLEQENSRLLSHIEKLQNELLYLRRSLFGRSSERYIREEPNQLKLDFGGQDSLPEEEQAVLDAAKQTITYQRKSGEARPPASAVGAGAQGRDYRAFRFTTRFKMYWGRGHRNP